MRSLKKGILISLEGIDGCGKSTVISKLVKKLNRYTYTDSFREPGGLKSAEDIRGLIFNKYDYELDAMTDLLLFEAARRENITKNIKPALDKGHLVLLDRFTDSTLAYQTTPRYEGQNVNLELNIRLLNNMVCDNIKPDMVFILDIDPDIAIKRILSDPSREINKYDNVSLDFSRELRNKYMQLALYNSNESLYIIVDADRDVDEIVSDICEDVIHFLSSNEYYPA